MSQRFDKDGNPCADVTVNQKAIDRKQREAVERAQRAAEDAAPWTRESLENEYTRASREGILVLKEGQQSGYILNLNGEDLSGLDLSGLNLSCVNLHSAKLVGTDFTGTTLAGSNMHSVDLSGAILKGADLGKANLCEACICDVDATEASFKGCNLSDACCEGAKGFGYTEKLLTPAEAQKVKYQQSEGLKAIADMESGVAKYADESLEGANITGLTTTHVEFESAKDLGTLGK